ncbi:RagB/SusD family nutrient uptake outer membrane protein [Tamlana fucoidanivorans]|uniref:RagB/SusD family nutrient uptake outer membrane protein n=1 Tax=Allotamlana fucoidanivorans TaxID=2583814 RepID=A0A5C4SNS7_9FLAO|nr:RagB/SusD family nutrient uptake outer membrane protein [Tamlana fucoidanivorans]TNJ45835.1 RagB/SusD family nutrient uptake outer membrane protein [Tamlana fucoidanivorans]
MKNIKYIFILTLVSIVGCSDLEENPISVLSPDGFYQSSRDVQTTINGCYGNMTEEAFWGRKLSLPLMLRSDMVGIGDVGTASRRIDHDNFTVNADNGMITAFWPRTYQIIAGANEAIAGASKISESEDILNPITAQAYFVRAYTYFHLVRLFGDIPYIDNPVDNIEAAKNISKTPATEVYTKIIADLEYAKQWLPDVQSSRSLPSKATAAGYLALVHLTMNEFDKAYTEAKFVIDNESRFDLVLADDFQDLFDATKQDGLKESLFEIDYNGFRDGNYGTDYQPALTGIRANQRGDIGGGWSVAVPNVEVYNRWDGRDYRKAVSLDTTAVFAGVEEPFMNFPNFDSRNIASPYIAKYTRLIGLSAQGNGRASQLNYAQLRYAEVLLIAAEALNEINPGSAEADGYINRVRARARNQAGTITVFPADVTPGMSQEAFRDMVLEERKWELAFECKRWYDIKRRQLGDEVFSASGIEQRPNFSASRDYLLPLPSDELLRNSNLEPNNPGY